MQRQQLRGTLRGAGMAAIALVLLLASACSDPLDVPVQQNNGECIYVNGQWQCPGS